MALNVALLKIASSSFLSVSCANAGTHASATDTATAALRSFFIIVVQVSLVFLYLLLYSNTENSVNIQLFTRPVNENCGLM